MFNKKKFPFLPFHLSRSTIDIFCRILASYTLVGNNATFGIEIGECAWFAFDCWTTTWEGIRISPVFEKELYSYLRASAWSPLKAHLLFEGESCVVIGQFATCSWRSAWLERKRNSIVDIKNTIVSTWGPGSSLLSTWSMIGCFRARVGFRRTKQK